MGLSGLREEDLEFLKDTLYKWMNGPSDLWGAPIFNIVLTDCRLYFLSVIYGVGIQKYE